MQTETPRLSSFLTLANPNFDLKNITPPKKEAPAGLPFQVSEMLPDDRPAHVRERLPYYLALNPRELALSSTPTPLTMYVPEIEFHIPRRHELILQLAREELKIDLGVPHGSPHALKKSCTGPLCRRTRRLYRNFAAQSRKARKNKYVSTSKPNTVPQYQAVEPLLTAFTILSHKRYPTLTNLTAEQKSYKSVRNLPELKLYLKNRYDTVR